MLRDRESESFHIELRQARISLGLSQEQFAEKAGISTVMQQRYETSKDKKYASRPNENTLKKIRRVLDDSVIDT